MLTRLWLFSKSWVILVSLGLLFMATAAATVESTSTLCDANGDGGVDRHDVKDLFRFLRHGGNPLPGNPDGNADGVVDFGDVVALLRALLSGVA
jgi:hypothetical protein